MTSAPALRIAPPTVATLRIATAGSVDDGKSTLIGRLLHDTKTVFEDQLAAVDKASRRYGDGERNLALLTDGLRAEREQGITIDVAHRYFATPHRSFIVADTPGHAQYTRNMVTGRVDRRRRHRAGRRPPRCGRADPPACVHRLTARREGDRAGGQQDGSRRLGRRRVRLRRQGSRRVRRGSPDAGACRRFPDQRVARRQRRRRHQNIRRGTRARRCSSGSRRSTRRVSPRSRPVSTCSGSSGRRAPTSVASPAGCPVAVSASVTPSPCCRAGAAAPCPAIQRFGRDIEVATAGQADHRVVGRRRSTSPAATCWWSVPLRRRSWCPVTCAG